MSCVQTETTVKLRERYADYLEAFYLMWYYFPAPVAMMTKNREAIAVNRAAEESNAVPGMKCFQWAGVKEIHETCQADNALRERDSRRQVRYNEEMQKVVDAYWLPVPGEEDLIIHIGVDITEYAKDELFPSARCQQ